MKKRLFALGCIAFSANAFAQSNQPVIQDMSAFPAAEIQATSLSVQPSINFTPFTSQNAASNGVQAIGDTLYYDDFSNPSNWVIQNSPATAGQGWSISSTQRPWYFANTAFNSTSGGNYAVMAPTNPNNNPAAATHTIRLAQAIDVSQLNTGVVLSFEQWFARFQDTFFVQVSNNNATWVTIEDNTWICVLTAQSGQTGCTASPNPNPANGSNRRQAFVPASVTGAGSDSLYVRFQWKSRQTAPNVGIGYGWMVDDLLVLEAADNDLFMEKKYFNKTDTIQARHYTEIPSRHAKFDTLGFAGIFTNRGSSAQTNARMNVVIQKPNATVDTVSTPGQFMASASTDSVTTPINYLFTLRGLHNISFRADADQTDDYPNDNAIVYPYRVSDTVFARDVNNPDRGTGRWYGAGTQYIMTNRFRLTQADTVKSISVFFSSVTAVGSVVSFHVYPASLTTPIVSNQFVTLQASDIDAWRSWNFTPTALPAGDYYVGYETFSDSVLWSYDQGNITSQFLDWAVDVNKNGQWGSGNDFFTPLIRMNLVGDRCQTVTTSFTVNSQASCGQNDGSATVNIVGVGPFSYTWPGGFTGQTNTNVGGGINTVTITDNDGCSFLVDVIMPNLNAPTVAANATNAQCFGQASGAVNLNISGGTPPLSFNWSGPNNFTANTQDLSNIQAGNYTVTITDANSCIANATATVTQPSELVLNLTQSTGSASVNATGGVPPYTYNWNNGGNTSTIDNLTQGNYTVTVTDANGCTAVNTILVQEGVGINSPEFAREISVFPNPNSGDFNVQFREMTGVVNVRVMSIIGQIVSDKLVNVSNGHVETISNLKSGMYLLQIENVGDKTSASYKIIVR